jgi:hypothetical protein
VRPILFQDRYYVLKDEQRVDHLARARVSPAEEGRRGTVSAPASGTTGLDTGEAAAYLWKRFHENVSMKTFPQRLLVL